MRLLIFLSLFSVSTFAQERPNIIYIMSDDHDADAISAYNKKLISTPNIDRIHEYSTDHTVIPHLGIKGQKYKLIYFYTANEWELYDLENDPDEQHNLIHSTASQKVFLQMQNELIKLRDLYDDHGPAGELN